MGITNEINTIRNKSEWMIKYLKNESDADKYAHQSNIKILCVCPICKKEKLFSPNSLYKQNRFTCQNCSDGISIPEKFGRGILNQIPYQYEVHKSFSWSENKIYDFYIQSLNIIIEAHGEQHYRGIRYLTGRSLKEEQENDLLKYNLAIQNGIKPENYIVVDCRKSEFNWLKENYIKQLGHTFDLSNIDWNAVYRHTITNLIEDVCTVWNNKTMNMLEIEEKFKISRGTLIAYLKNGTEYGICDYDPKQQTIDSGKIRSKTVYQYDLNNIYLREYYSTREASRQTGISYGSISECCNGKRNTCGGFIWTYIKREEIDYNE